jgi:hypothetical protein
MMATIEEGTINPATVITSHDAAPSARAANYEPVGFIALKQGLLSQLRERQFGRFATATPATLATHEAEDGMSVATVATSAKAVDLVLPLERDEERAIRASLALIQETDPALVAAVLSQCRRDPDAKANFIRTAAELLDPDPPPGVE